MKPEVALMKSNELQGQIRLRHTADNQDERSELRWAQLYPLQNLIQNEICASVFWEFSTCHFNDSLTGGGS